MRIPEHDPARLPDTLFPWSIPQVVGIVRMSVGEGKVEREVRGRSADHFVMRIRRDESAGVLEC